MLSNTITKGAQASPQSSKAPSDGPAQSYSELSSNDQEAHQFFTSEYKNECKMYVQYPTGWDPLVTNVDTINNLTRILYSCYHLSDTLKVWYANLCRKIIPSEEAATEASWDQYATATRVLVGPPKDFNVWLNAWTNVMEKVQKTDLSRDSSYLTLFFNNMTSINRGVVLSKEHMGFHYCR